MRPTIRTAVPLLGAALLLALFAGCSDDTLAPYEPEVSNQTDSFSLQATDVRNVTLTRDYAWQNTGTTANVNQATTASAGSVHLTIYDDGDTVVYDGDLTGNGTFQTDAGAAGMWTIRIRLSGFSGTINFSAEAP